MRRILYVVNASWFFVSHRLPIALQAKRNGFDVHVAATPSGEVDTIVEAGLEFHPLEIRRSGGNPLREVQSLIQLLRLYRRLKPDIVHHVTSKPVLYGSIAARMAAVPAIVNAIPGLGLVFSARGRMAEFRRGLVLLAYRIALPRKRCRVIFQNVENRDLFVRKLLVRQEDTVLIRGSGVDLGEFNCSPESGDTPVVVLASRMLREKGVPEFVEAARMWNRHGVSARFALFGGTDTETPGHIPADQLEEWNAEGDVHWYGHDSDMARVFSAAHIVCLPTYYGEGVPKALIEAAASGRPIVTTDVPGCRDIVRHEWNGLVVPPRDVTALADAIGRLIEDRELRTTMGRRGRSLVENEFALGRVVADTLKVYEQMRPL